MSKNKERTTIDKREIIVSDIFRDFGVLVPFAVMVRYDRRRTH